MIIISRPPFKVCAECRRRGRKQMTRWKVRRGSYWVSLCGPCIKQVSREMARL